MDSDKIIEDGLKAIDEDIKTDEDIREIGRLLRDELIRNESIRVTDLNGNWELDYYLYTYDNRQYVKLRCFNETRKLMAPNYRPLIIDAEIDDDYNAEEALEAATTAFVAKMYDRFIVQEIEDNE